MASGRTQPGGFSIRRPPAALLLGAVALGLVLLAWLLLRPAETREKEEALRLARDGRLPEADAALRAYLTAHPDDAEAIDAEVGVLIRAGKLATEVEPFLDRLCALRPTDPASFRMRLDLRRRIGNRDGALADGRHVLELVNDDHDTRQAVAVLGVEVGQYELAERELATLIAARPGDRVAIGTVLARSFYDAGDFPRAEATLNEFAPPAAAFPPAQVLRGVLHYEAGRYDQAEAALKGPAAGGGPEQAFALYYLARTLVQLGRSEEAQRHFDRLAALQRAERAAMDAVQRPDDMASQVRAARASLDVDKPDAARQVIEAALARLGPDREALKALADCFDALGRPGAAADARARAGAVSR